MTIREATAEDWPAIWPFMRQIVAAGDTFPYDQDMDESQARGMWLSHAPARTVGRSSRTGPFWARGEGYRAMQFNAVAESNTRAVALYRSLGFDVLATIPEGFRHPTEGYVGLHIMHRSL